jgi:hypothetical protein
MSEQEQIAAFIASRGVTRIAEGAGNGYTRRDWHAMVRGDVAPRDAIGERHLVVVDAAGKEFWMNGIGERLT